MDDTHDAISTVRRDVRRVEDDLADFNRKKASNDDVGMIAAKQSALETDFRQQKQSSDAALEEIRSYMKRLSSSLEMISDELVRHKRKTATDIEELSTTPIKGKGNGHKEDRPPKEVRPFLPMQLQITLYILAGVGLMALIQNAPAALNTIPRLSFGG